MVVHRARADEVRCVCSGCHKKSTKCYTVHISEECNKPDTSPLLFLVKGLARKGTWHGLR